MVALINTALDTLHCWSELARLEALARRRALKHVPKTNDILLIAWQFPPIVTGGVYRPLSFVRHFASQGEAVTVVCAEPVDTSRTDGAELLEQVPASVRVSRVSRSRRRVPGHRYFPRVDGEMSWALSIVSHTLALYGKARPRVVLASSPPFHDAVAGVLLSRIWDVPLVADYRDEWTENQMDFVTKGRDDRRWEERLNRCAARVVVLSDAQRVHHERAFALSPSACAVVTNGWEPEDHLRAQEHQQTILPEDGAIQIVFTGFIAKHTAPDALLRATHEMLGRDPTVHGRRVALHFIGQKSGDCLATLNAHAAAYPDEAAIICTGPLPKSEALAITHQADILLVLNPPAVSRCVPGKMYEYLATDRPILVYGAGGELERVVTQTECGVVVPENDPDALRSAIAMLTSGRSWDGSARRQWLDAHRREVQAAKMLRVLKEVAP